MDLTQVIVGEVVTEKAEAAKAKKVHTLKVHPKATKIDVKQALRRHYGVEPADVRIMKVKPKRRLVGRGKYLQKRDQEKRAIVTLGEKSKVLDLTSLST